MKVSDHQGHAIELNARHKFVVKGPLFDDNYERQFDTYERASEAIDDRVKRDATEKTVSLGLPVLRDDGQGVVTIKGIHSRLGNLLFTDSAYSKAASESYGGPARVYPNVKWLNDVLIEKAMLEKRLGTMRETLSRYEIQIAYARTGIGKSQEFVEAIEDLKKEHADKLAAATKAAT